MKRKIAKFIVNKLEKTGIKKRPFFAVYFRKQVKKK
jgi:hypothetical protein